MIPIVFSFNKGYIPYAKVAISSILKRCSSKVKLYCLGLDLQEKDFDYFRNLMINIEGEFSGIHFNSNQLSEFRDIGYLTKTTYLRIFIPDLIKEDKVIYCDCDTLFLADITELYNIPFDGKYIIGAEDWGSLYDREFDRNKKLQLNQVYINCGIIVLNNKALREINFVKTCFEINKKYYDEIKYADQCIINKALDGFKKIMPLEWNYQFLSRHNSISLFPKVKAIHFLEAIKLWMPNKTIKGNYEFWLSEALSYGFKKEEIGIQQ